MKLDIGYGYISQGSQEITLDEEAYLNWARGPVDAPYPFASPDEELLKDEHKILFYLNEILGPKKVSDLIGWGEDVIDVWDIDFLD